MFHNECLDLAGRWLKTQNPRRTLSAVYVISEQSTTISEQSAAISEHSAIIRHQGIAIS